MKIIRGIKGLKTNHGVCVATIGNFDGVHIGHETVIRFLASKAKQLNLPMVVITFEPHPREFFTPENSPPRISILRDKISRLAALGVDRFLLLKFDESLARMKADEFINQVLVDGLGVQFLVVGDDFRFGFHREGSFETLERAGDVKGFAVAQMPACLIDGSRVSSSRIRHALKVHDLSAVSRMLGRPYRISGRVITGKKLGRQLGFPTANVALPSFKMAVSGVYAVKVLGISDTHLDAIANVGNRPSVGGEESLLEVHLIGYDGDLYDRYIAVDFYHHVRLEKKFSSLSELKQQIGQDVAEVKEFFKNHPQVV